MSVRILIGDCLEQMRALENESVHCIVTSPPYWGLRDYRVAGQIGLEATPGAYLERILPAFREMHRVLRKDGTLWVNMGDSYCGAPGGWQGKNGQRASRTFTARIELEKRVDGLKPKDLVGMPWRLAFALQADGWWLRQDIIWSKPNPMPESVRDRCTKAHEYLFLLSKAERYYFDQAAIAEACSPETHPRLARNATANGSARANGGTRADRPMKALAPRHNSVEARVARAHAGNKSAPTSERNGIRPRKYAGEIVLESQDHRAHQKQGRVKGEASQRMGRDLGWRKSMGVPTGWAGTPDEHRDSKRGRYTPRQNESFEAATSAEVLDRRNKRSVWTIGSEPFKGAHFATFPTALVEPCILAGCPGGGTVLDPFAGAGTTGLVADRLGRNSILIELNAEYARMARERIKNEAPLLAEVA